jgi:hypothetical protein
VVFLAQLLITAQIKLILVVMKDTFSLLILQIICRWLSLGIRNLDKAFTIWLYCLIILIQSWSASILDLLSLLVWVKIVYWRAGFNYPLTQFSKLHKQNEWKFLNNHHQVMVLGNMLSQLTAVFISFMSRRIATTTNQLMLTPSTTSRVNKD